MSNTAARNAQTRCHTAPVIRAPEKVHHIFRVMFAVACIPLLGGIAVFGWRAGMVALVSVVSCVVIEWAYFKVTHTPSMLGRSHAFLTGLLLALTLPAFTPLWVVVLAAAFAILVGKTIFGGVGHFLWQPALLGRFAVAIIVPFIAPQQTLEPQYWPVLAKANLFFGDVQDARQFEPYQGWSKLQSLEKAQAFKIKHPADQLTKLTRGEASYSSLATLKKNIATPKPALLSELPPMSDMIWGTRPGSIGETCAVLIIAAGLYLVYRNYIKLHLPLAFIMSAWIIAAVMPVNLAGANNSEFTLEFPLIAEQLDIGITYANYRILSGELLLAAFFLAPEMTSRPVTKSGQIIFGIGCGSLGMICAMYLPTAIPFYVAVLFMNTFTPTIDRIWQPRAWGQ